MRSQPFPKRSPASASNGTAPPAELALNTRALAASNDKEERARDAEGDAALIRRAQSGDEGAFRQLVERHQRRAFALAYAIVRNENDARELVQDAFLRVFKSLPSFQGGSTFYTWLYRIITNLGIDFLRKPGRQAAELDEERLGTAEYDDMDAPFVSRYDGANPMDVVRRREIGARLQTALDDLPTYHRAVIILRELEGLSYEEIAEAMGVSKGTVMSRLFHARQKLQKALADCYAEQLGVRVPNEAQASGGES